MFLTINPTFSLCLSSYIKAKNLREENKFCLQFTIILLTLQNYLNLQLFIICNKVQKKHLAILQCLTLSVALCLTDLLQNNRASVIKPPQNLSLCTF